MLIYYLIFSFFILLALYEGRFTLNTKQQLFILAGIILVFFAGLRGEGIDNDYFNYKAYFEDTPSLNHLFSSDYLRSKIKIEPSLILINSTIKTIHKDGFAIVIFIYALLGISLKMKAIYRIAEFPFLSLLIYFTTLFFLQDLTQIRTGVAVGFIFFSFIALNEQKNIKFFLLILLASLFHYSSLLFVISFFLNKERINKLLYLLIVFVPILLNISGHVFVDFLTSFNLGIYTEKLNDYIIAKSWLKEDINLFNFSIIFQLIMSIVFIFISEKAENRYAILFTKLFCIGIAIFYVFSFSPTLSFRLSELFTSVQVFLIPLLIKFFKPKLFAEIIIVTISILYFLNYVVINSIAKSYYLIFS